MREEHCSTVVLVVHLLLARGTSGCFLPLLLRGAAHTCALLGKSAHPGPVRRDQRPRDASHLILPPGDPR